MPHISTKYPYITEPAPWFAGAMGNRTPPHTPNWNMPNLRAHPVIAAQPLLDEFSIAWQATLYRARHEAMLSVDDIVNDVVTTLDKLGVLDNTYIFFTSDHGYALGQQARPCEKLNVYDNDIRVHMLKGRSRCGLFHTLIFFFFPGLFTDSGPLT